MSQLQKVSNGCNNYRFFLHVASMHLITFFTRNIVIYNAVFAVVTYMNMLYMFQFILVSIYHCVYETIFICLERASNKKLKSVGEISITTLFYYKLSLLIRIPGVSCTCHRGADE